jgi:hypothetical protein
MPDRTDRVDDIFARQIKRGRNLCLSKLTAAKLVKELVDEINALLEKLNLSIRINAPADKPEVPSTGTAQGSNA